MARRVLIRALDAPVPELPPALAGLRIAHVSDFHFRRWTAVFEDAQRLLRMLDYDLLVATGDFGNSVVRWHCAAVLAQRFFEPLAGRTPIFAVLGNHDRASAH